MSEEIETITAETFEQENFFKKIKSKLDQGLQLLLISKKPASDGYNLNKSSAFNSSRSPDIS